MEIMDAGINVISAVNIQHIESLHSSIKEITGVDVAESLKHLPCNAILMKIKARLTFGVGLVFGMIVLLSLLGAFSINALKKDTQNLFIANYNTLEYVGGKDATDRLSMHFTSLTTNAKDSSFYREIRLDISEIMNLNMQAQSTEERQGNRHCRIHYNLNSGNRDGLFYNSVRAFAEPAGQYCQSIDTEHKTESRNRLDFNLIKVACL